MLFNDLHTSSLKHWAMRVFFLFLWDKYRGKKFKSGGKENDTGWRTGEEECVWFCLAAGETSFENQLDRRNRKWWGWTSTKIFALYVSTDNISIIIITIVFWKAGKQMFTQPLHLEFAACYWKRKTKKAWQTRRLACRVGLIEAGVGGGGTVEIIIGLMNITQNNVRYLKRTVLTLSTLAVRLHVRTKTATLHDIKTSAATRPETRLCDKGYCSGGEAGGRRTRLSKWKSSFLLSFSFLLPIVSVHLWAAQEMLSASISQTRILQTCAVPHPNMVSGANLQGKPPNPPLPPPRPPPDSHKHRRTQLSPPPESTFGVLLSFHFRIFTANHFEVWLLSPRGSAAAP